MRMLLAPLKKVVNLFFDQGSSKSPTPVQTLMEERNKLRKALDKVHIKTISAIHGTDNGDRMCWEIEKICNTILKEIKP